LALSRAFELRQRVDYREQAKPTHEQAAQIVEDADRFTKAIAAHLTAGGKM
jgi:uncharacterized protein (UPF0332 family)